MPQGRRLWRSLSVDEHLRLAQRGPRGSWTPERIYDTFPRLAERKDNAGSQLSGGEQQMLAISRALLLNPRLLIMDEPTEGLAPVIVAQVEDMLVQLSEEGDVAILVIEQNIGVATEISDTVAIMVNGRVNRVIEAARLPPIATCSSVCSASAGTATRRSNVAWARGTRRPRTAAAPARTMRRSGSICRTRCRRPAGAPDVLRRGSRHRAHLTRTPVAARSLHRIARSSAA